MTNAKRYYWLKLKKDFFTDKRIKKLRKIAGGDTYTIIYLKMQLLSLQDEGILYYDDIEDSFEEEIALQIDEDIEDVRITIGFLIHTGLILKLDDCSYELIETKKCIGSETDSAERVRKHRENKIKLLQCNTNVTKCNTEIEIEKDIDIEKKEIHKEKRFKKPTLQEVEEYCKERNNEINPQRFIDFYESKNWMIGKNKMKDWKACIRTWERKNDYTTYTIQTPNWFDKKTDKEEMTESEKKELENLLNDM